MEPEMSAAPARGDDDVRRAVAGACNMRDALTRLGMDPRGQNYNVLRARIARLGLDVSHWTGATRNGAHGFGNSNRRPLDAVLIESGPPVSTHHLKRRLVADGLLNEACAECGLSEWRGSALTLQLDHVNGVCTDHRLENLRLLCPNCHAQTPTYRGRNKNAAA